MAVIRINTKISVILHLLLSLSLVSSSRNHRWPDVTRWEGPTNPLFDSPELKDQIFVDDFDCNVEGQCEIERDDKGLKMIETNEIPFKRIKANAALTGLAGFDKLLQIEDNKSGTNGGTVPYFQTSIIPLSCACGSHYSIMDLGRAYQPRYLVTAVCDVDTCGAGGTYRCRQRFYRVRVLKKKDARGVQSPEKEPDQVSNPSLPESLKKMWVFETFTVTVACECGP